MFEQKEKVVALIAAGCSTVTEPLAESSHYWNLLQVIISEICGL